VKNNNWTHAPARIIKPKRAGRNSCAASAGCSTERKGKSIGCLSKFGKVKSNLNAPGINYNWPTSSYGNIFRTSRKGFTGAIRALRPAVQP